MNINDIVIKPIITEKSSSLLERNVYTFEVHPRATKIDIKKAIETIFSKSNAKVLKVNIIKVDRKYKRLGRSEGYKKGYKKALVYLSKGSIPIYGSDVVENTSKKPKKIPKIINTDKILEQAEKENK